MYIGAYNVEGFGRVHLTEEEDSYRMDDLGHIRITGRAESECRISEGYQPFMIDIVLELDEDGYIVPLEYDDERWDHIPEKIITSINESHKKTKEAE